MFDRANIVDQNFIKRVSERDFPEPIQNIHEYEYLPDKETAIDIFESMIMSRHLDLQARILKAQNQSFYTIGSAGHEGNAVLGKVFPYSDPAFLHYRSAAFMIQRSKQIGGSTPLYDLLLSFVAAKEDPISGGRHKVLGSKILNIPPQTSTIASHLPKAVGCAFSIPRAKSMGIKAAFKQDNLVLCNFGDASANHATALSAFNSAGWCSFQNIPLPIVFICEDNGLGISVRTPENWIEQSFRHRPGIKYFQCNGLDIVDTYDQAKKVEQYVRRTRRPAFLHIKVVRLLGHAGSDIESTYHTSKQILNQEAKDPLLFGAGLLCQKGYLSPGEIIDIYQKIRDRVKRISQEVIKRPKLETIQQVGESIYSEKQIKQPVKIPEHQLSQNISLKHPMAKLINLALKDLMEQYQNIVVFGEDVAKKGGVYHVTNGLFKTFGERRVFNTVLDETTILGIALGMAHNGFLPIPEIQFLAYVHNAEDQIRGEAATLSFFSNGQFQNPMVLRIPGLAYQKGFGGHFHNDNSLAIFRDIPGVIIACPSNGEDAVKMLRSCVQAAYEYGRVVIFIEPIALYMTRDLYEKGDEKYCFDYPSAQQTISVGEYGIFGSGTDVAILSYGNGAFFSKQALQILKQEHSINGTLFDLRWMAPLNTEKLKNDLKKFNIVVIVDECRETGSFNEQLVKLISLNCTHVTKIKVVAGVDCFIPLGVAATSGLPQKEDIIQAVLEVVGES